MKKKSIFSAALIIILIGLWVGSGYLGGDSENGDIPQIDPRENDFTVKYIESNASNFTDILKINGKTEADSIVELSMQTDGKIKNILFKKGENEKMFSREKPSALLRRRINLNCLKPLRQI